MWVRLMESRGKWIVQYDQSFVLVCCTIGLDVCYSCKSALHPDRDR